jgi:flap endonuclease-1
MGIRGLNTCLLRTAPQCISPITWNSWKGTRVGIDIQCFIYRALANHNCPLKTIAAQIILFREKDITPIYIFEGKPPAEKNTIVEKRRNDRHAAFSRCAELKKLLEAANDNANREILINQIREIESQFPNITYEMKDEIKKLLYAAGIMFVTANCEADILIAYWCRRNVLDGVVSLDLDFIARGCQLIVPKDSDFKSCIHYDPLYIRSELGLNETQFLDLCVLMGSDYTSDLPIVSWKLALSSLKRGDTLTSIWAKHTFSNWRQNTQNNHYDSDIESFRRAKLILNGSLDNAAELMEAIQWDKWNLGPQKPEPSTLNEFRKLNPDWDSQWWDRLALTL